MLFRSTKKKRKKSISNRSSSNELETNDNRPQIKNLHKHSPSNPKSEYKTSHDSLYRYRKPTNSTDFLEVNKCFVKNLSDINHEINSNYNCLIEAPRLKVPKPELVMQLVKYNSNLNKRSSNNSKVNSNDELQ